MPKDTTATPNHQKGLHERNTREKIGVQESPALALIPRNY